MGSKNFWRLSLLVVTIAWGGSFLAVHSAMKIIAPEMFVFLRFLFAALLLLLLRGRSLLRGLTKTALIDGFKLGFLAGLGFLLQTLGLVYTTPSNAAFITGLSVVFVPVGLYFLGDGVSKNVWQAVFLSFIGLFILTVKHQTLSVINMGDVYIFGCAIAFAAHVIWASRVSYSCDVWALTWVQFVVTALMGMFVCLFTVRNFDYGLLRDINVIQGLVYTTVFCTVVAYVIMNYAQRTLSAWEAGIIYSTEPLFASFLAVALAFEPATISMVVGGFLIVLSMVRAIL